MRSLAAAVAVGVLLGLLDLVAQTNLSYPWADLGNSPAVWGLVAVALGIRVGRPAVAAAAGAAAMVVAVLVYYLAATIALGDNLSNATNSTAVYWYAGGIGIGAVGGLAGAWVRARTATQAVLGSAFPVALAWAEASVQYVAADDRSGWNGNTSTALLLGLIGLAIALALARRTSRRRLPALAGAIVALSFIGHLCYRAVGLQGFGS